MQTIQAIYVADQSGAPMCAVESARLVAGVGIVEDRYAANSGTFSGNPGDHELTLVEAEVIEELEATHRISIGMNGTRRNLVTRGIRLNDLVGKRFRVGEALCEGTRLCEPCAHLERLTGIGGLVRLMAGRGGLRAVIVESGTVRSGDTITVLPSPPNPLPLEHRGRGLGGEGRRNDR
ncbi:MAG: hypothetical protein OHK0029_20300 [Armatimonadaceae bacterium]